MSLHRTPSPANVRTTARECRNFASSNRQPRVVTPPATRRHPAHDTRLNEEHLKTRKAITTQIEKSTSKNTKETKTQE